MTETYFNDLTARVGTATIAFESVTATVIKIDLYVYWKPGFRVKLEALLSSSLSVVREGNTLGSNDSRESIAPVGFKFNDLTNTWQPVISLVGDLDLTANDLKIAVEFQGLVLEAVTTVGINDSTVWLDRQQLSVFFGLGSNKSIGGLEFNDSTVKVLV